MRGVHSELVGRPLMPFFPSSSPLEPSFFAVNDTGQDIAVRRFNQDGNFEDPVVIVASIQKAKENYAKEKSDKKKLKVPKASKIGTKSPQLKSDEGADKFAMSAVLISPPPSAFPLPNFSSSAPAFVRSESQNSVSKLTRNPSKSAEFVSDVPCLFLRRNGNTITVPLRHASFSHPRPPLDINSSTSPYESRGSLINSATPSIRHESRGSMATLSTPSIRQENRGSILNSSSPANRLENRNSLTYVLTPSMKQEARASLSNSSSHFKSSVVAISSFKENTLSPAVVPKPTPSGGDDIMKILKSGNKKKKSKAEASLPVGMVPIAQLSENVSNNSVQSVAAPSVAKQQEIALKKLLKMKT